MVKGLSIMTLFFLHFEEGYFQFQHNYFIVRSPAFYIVVGWLWGMSTKDRTIKQHWDKRKKGLVIPYIWLSIIFIAFDAITALFGLQDIKILWRDIYKTVCLRGIGTLWFLPALFGGEMLFLSVKNRKPLNKACYYLIAFSLIYAFYLWGQCTFLDNIDYQNILKAPITVIKDVFNAFIYISVAFYIARRFGRKVMAQPKPKLFAEGLSMLILSYFILNHLIGSLFIYIILFMIGNACAGFGILLLFTSIETFNPIAKPLEYFGKNSLIVMAFHYCLLFQIALIFNRVVLKYDTYSGGITVIYFLIAVIIQIALIEIINRRFKFLIGK